jgi:hypothetical protein
MLKIPSRSGTFMAEVLFKISAMEVGSTVSSADLGEPNDVWWTIRRLVNLGVLRVEKVIPRRGKVCELMEPFTVALEREKPKQERAKVRGKTLSTLEKESALLASGLALHNVIEGWSHSHV